MDREEELQARPKIEVRSIDYVPMEERSGKVAHLLPVWFQGNAELVTLTVGLIGIGLGLNFAWSAVAIVLGTLLGTLFMAFHSAQGPKLGLPQMIQSRPQFGYFGSLLPVVMAVLLFIGFNVFNTIIAGETVQAVLGTSFRLSEFLIVIAAVLFTLLGYHWIHRGLRWATWVFVAVYGVLTVGAFLAIDLPRNQTSLLGTFSLGPFLVQFGVVTSYQLTWAPYVSEYARYLPADTKTSAAFWYTYLGSGLGAVWTMILGAFVQAAFPDLAPIDAIKAAGDQIVDGFGSLVLLLSWPGLIAVIAMNMYSGGLSTLTAVDVVAPIRPTLRARVMGVAFIAVAATTLALTLPEEFLTPFYNFLLIILYFMIPWSVINLVDYFFVRREKYAILDLFKRHVIYGRWNWRGIVSYVVGFMVMVPFMSTALYTGPVASALGGGDISPFVGGPVAGILYYLLTRGTDVEKEWAIAKEQREVLDGASAHRA